MGSTAGEQGERSDPVQVLKNSRTFVPERANLGKPKTTGRVERTPKMTRNQKQTNQSNHKSSFNFGLSEGENSSHNRTFTPNTPFQGSGTFGERGRKTVHIWGGPE